jgi:hypothetical protein
VLLAALASAAFLAFLLAATGGHFVPPVSDLYVVCQYAKAMAEGHPFQYNAGEPASTGATSLLHTAILALAHALGFQGERLVAFAVFLGIALLLASVTLAVRLATRLAGPREGLLAGALVALGAPVVWGFLYGSDIALFLFLALWLFERLVATWDGPIASALLPACLLALARPEGLPIAALLAVSWWRRGRGRGAWLPVFTGLGVLALHRAVTGLWLGTSIADKSLFASYGVAEGLAMVSEYAVDVLRGLLLGFYPSQAPIGLARGWASISFPPLGLLLVLLALAEARLPTRAPTRLWALTLALVAALDMPNVFLGVHFNRYLLWAFPALLVLVAVGLADLTRLVARDDEARERRLFAWAAAFLLVVQGLSTLRFAALYGEAAGAIARRDVAAARWIAATLPPGAAIASAATSVEYLTGHRNMNLHGVTSPAFFGGRSAEREASMLEGLARLPAAERPPYLLTSRAVQASYQTLRELASGDPLFETTSGDDELLILRTRWQSFEHGGSPLLPETRAAVAGLALGDRLNVCDGLDEAAHAYVYDSQLGGQWLSGSARSEDYALAEGAVRVADAGRAILGSETFRVRTRRGRDLVVVLRTAASVEARIQRASGATSLGLSFAEAGLTASIASAPVAEAKLAPRPGWDELVLRIPGSALSEGATTIRIAGRYASFQYWFYQ